MRIELELQGYFHSRDLKGLRNVVKTGEEQ
jgi:hypothetical protein